MLIQTTHFAFYFTPNSFINIQVNDHWHASKLSFFVYKMYPIASFRTFPSMLSTVIASSVFKKSRKYSLWNTKKKDLKSLISINWTWIPNEIKSSVTLISLLIWKSDTKFSKLCACEHAEQVNWRTLKPRI